MGGNINQTSDLIEGNDIQMLLKIMQLSSPSLKKGEIGSALKNLLNLLEKSFKAKQSWVIEEDRKDLSLLWDLENPLVKEEVLLGDRICEKIDKTYFHLEIDKPFLIHKYHLIFPFEYKEKNIWVGFSAPHPIELNNESKTFWEIIAERLKELCTFYMQLTVSKAENIRFETIFDQMPQSIIFSEEENGPTLLNKEALKLFRLSSDDSIISFELFSEKFANLKDKVINKEEVDLMGKSMFSLGGAFPSSFGEDWIWKFEKKVLKVIRKDARINGRRGDLWVFDNVSELYYANERLNSLFRTLNVAYDEINANLTEFQTKSTGKKSITDLEAEESKIIQQYDNNDIFGKVTHDLRTPFAKVYTIVQLLLTDHQENLTEQQVERISLIKQVVADGLQIVKGFLDTGNLVLDDKKYEPDVINIPSFLNDCLVPYELLSARKNIIFITQILGNDLYLEADKTYLKRIIDNLVSNAIKFSPFETQINFNVSREGDEILFSVKDQGPGMTNDDKSRLFKKYQQLSAKPIGTDESTGLGLYIVKSMVDKMGGKIWVESEHGKGSNFLVSFPSIKA